MADQNIQIEVSSGNVETELKTVAGSLGNLNRVIEDAITQVIKYNKNNEATRVVLRGFADDGKKVTVELRNMEGAWKIFNTRVDESTAKLKAQAQALREASLNRTGAAASETTLRQLFPTPSNATFTQLSAYEARLRQINALVLQNKVSPADVERIAQSVSQGQVLGGLTPDQGRVQNALAGIKRQFTETAVEARRSANAVAQSFVQMQAALNRVGASSTEANIRKLFPTPDTATFAQLSAYESRLRQINALVARGKVTPQDAGKIAQSVSQGQVLSGLTPDQGKIQNSLVSISRLFQDTQGRGVTAAAAIEQAWNRLDNVISRLLIRQAVFALVGAVRQGVTSFEELQVKLGQVQVASGANTAEFARLSAQIRSLSDNTGFKQVDLASASILLFQQRSVDANNVTGLLNQSVKLANASFSTVDQSAKALTTTLNAYNLSNDRATQVSALLFRTAQFGRTSVEELSNGLARVAPIAQATGLSLNQVAGFVAALGDKGINATQSTSLLEGVLQKLLQPSTELQLVYKQLGISTGEQAIATFGFVGTLQKLFEISGGNVSNLEKLVGGLGEFKAVIAASNGDFESLSSRINDVSSAVDRLDKANATIVTGSGKELQRQFEEIKNFFTNEVGGGFVSALDKLGSAFGGLSGGVKFLSTAAIIGGTAWTTYKLATLASAGATVAFGTTATATAAGPLAYMAGGLNATTTAAIRTRAALTGVLAGGGLFVATIAAGALLPSLLGSSSGDINRVGDTSIDKIQERLQKQTDAENEASQKRRDIIVKEFDAKVAAVEKFVAAASRLSNNILDELAKQQKDFAVGLKLSADAVLGEESQKLSDINRKASEARAEIDRSTKSVATFEARSNEATFGRAVRFETDPVRQRQIINDRIVQIDREARAQFASGDKDEVSAARQKFDQIEQLRERAFDLEIKAKERRVQLGLDQPVTRLDSFGQLERVIPVDINAPLRDNLKLQKERIGLEEKYREVQKRNQEEARREAIVEGVRIAAIKDTVNKLVNFNPLDAEGKIKKEFVRSTPEESFKAALGERDALEKRLTTLTGDSEITKRINEFSNLSKTREILEKQALAAITQDFIKQSNERLLQDQRETKEKLDNLEKLRSKQAELGNSAIQNLVSNFKALADASNLSLFQQSQLIAGEGGDAGRTSKTLIARNAVAERIQGTLGNVISGDRSKETLDRLEKDLSEFTSLYNTLGNLGSDKLNVRGALNSPGGQSSALVSKQLFESLKSLKDSTVGVQETNRQLSEQEANLKRIGEVLSEVTTRFGKLGAVAQEELRKFDTTVPKQGIEELLDGMERAFEQLERLKSRVGEIGSPKVRQTSGILDFRNGEGGVVYAAEGGFIPKGTDTQPAMLTGGEYVWDVETTRKFAPVIKGLHDGSLAPSQFLPQGGPVTTVGDINVTVTDAGANPEKAAMDIINAVKRHIRRGTLTGI